MLHEPNMLGCTLFKNISFNFMSHWPLSGIRHGRSVSKNLFIEWVCNAFFYGGLFCFNFERYIGHGVETSFYFV